LSDTPEKKHSWAKFRAQPGPPKVGQPSRPAPSPALPPAKPAARSERVTPPAPVAAPARPPGSATPAATPPAFRPPGGLPPAASRAADASSPVSDELAAALQKLAAEYAAPAVTSAPFVTAMQRQEETQARKREARRRLIRLGVIVAVLAVALHLTVTRVLYRTPDPDAIESHVQALPETVLPFYSSSRQPLQPGPVVYAETDRVDANRIRYAAEVTLRLRVPLYVPASTNGTAAYRQLQESMQMARQRDIQFSLFTAEDSPPHPDLPLLLQMSHRAGDSIVVRVPFEARRFGWKWRLQPAQIPLRTVNRAFSGDAIEYYRETPYLIYGAPGSMAEVRLLMRQARAYIIAVTQEIQRHADVEAVSEKPAPTATPDTPTPEPAPESAASKPLLSLEELTRLIDPNAPAVVVPDDAAATKKGPGPVGETNAASPNTPATKAPATKGPERRR
jgi:hypothetical protein